MEKAGILKHHYTAEEIDAGNVRARELTELYLTGKMELPEFRAETDKLPKLDLVQIASALPFKG